MNAYEWAPGAKWKVDDVNQVKTLDVNPLPAEISLKTEELIRGDMQSIVGGLSFSAGG